APADTAGAGPGRAPLPKTGAAHQRPAVRAARDLVCRGRGLPQFPGRGSAARAGRAAATGFGVASPALSRAAPLVQALRRPGNPVQTHAPRLGADATRPGPGS